MAVIKKQRIFCCCRREAKSDIVLNPCFSLAHISQCQPTQNQIQLPQITVCILLLFNPLPACVCTCMCVLFFVSEFVFLFLWVSLFSCSFCDSINIVMLFVYLSVFLLTNAQRPI